LDAMVTGGVGGKVRNGSADGMSEGGR